MKDYNPETFGELKADDYDAYCEGMERETRDSVAFLAALAAGGRVLEFAIGTGRVALPLAATGLEVHGIEASEHMVAKMREKPGGEAIPVTIGDMADARAEGQFDLVYLVFNTIWNLTTQDAQVRCFENAARHLSPKGVFLIEVVVPDFSEYVDGQRVKARWAEKDAIKFEIAVQDRVAQTVDFQRIVMGETGAQMSPHFMRYSYPPEHDLMARIAGLELRERYAWWDRTPFTSESKSHVSIYGAREG